MELIRSSISIVSGLPCVTVRSAPAIIFSGPAQRSLVLRPARSRSRHATLSTESSDSFVASAAASIATGWSEPVPGREFHPLKSNAFHGALLRQLTCIRAAPPSGANHCHQFRRGQAGSETNARDERPDSISARMHRLQLRPRSSPGKTQAGSRYLLARMQALGQNRTEAFFRRLSTANGS